MSQEQEFYYDDDDDDEYEAAGSDVDDVLFVEAGEDLRDAEIARLQAEHLSYYTRNASASLYKDCPKCGRVVRKSSSVCGHCGHGFGVLGWLFGR